MGNSVSVVVAVWGVGYASFIPRWWDSVKRLKRQPDEIVLVAEMHDGSKLLEVPEWVTSKVVKVKTECDHYQQWWTVAVHSATSDYIVQMPIDDQFGAQALDFAEQTTADLIIDRVQVIQGGEWEARWEPAVPDGRRFAPGGISPFHKRLLPIWDRIPNDTHWNDWVWYLLLAKENPAVYRTNAIRMLHDNGREHKTMSGVLLDFDTRIAADEQLERIRQELSI